MKKRFLTAICLGVISLFGIGLGVSLSASQYNAPIAVLAEGEGEGGGETVTAKPCSVIIEKAEHGKISTDISEGEIGEIVTITADPSFGYLIDTISVNGVVLIESEDISGLFSFALVEGENKITGSFVVDEELFGTFATMYDQAMNKDWTNLFTVENLLVIVKWLLDGGVLILLARYYIKDKRLEKKVEENINNNMTKIIPDATKTTVVATVKNVVEPLFVNMQSEMITITEAMSVFAKCLALSQENTPEAKLAILNALQGLNISDQKAIENTKAYIEDLVKRAEKTYQETLTALNNIDSKNNVIQAEKEALIPEKGNIDSSDNGTQI